jgi:hypothetical protein
MQLIRKSSAVQAASPSRTADSDAPVQLARACVASASLSSFPLKARDYPLIRDACGIGDSPARNDLGKVMSWVLTRRGLVALAEHWGQVLRVHYVLFSHPVQRMPWIMLSAAGAVFVLTVLIDWMLGLRLATEQTAGTAPATYSIPRVLTELVGRLSLLCITTIAAVYGVYRACFPKSNERLPEEDLSVADRIANRIVQALGRLQKHLRKEEVTKGEVVADAARRLIFRLVRPTQVVLASALLLVGASTLGLNAGHYVAYRLVEGQINESAPVWRANIEGDREWLLERWVKVTRTPRAGFTGSDDLAPLMDWLRQSPKQARPEIAKSEGKWRDSFSRLIGKSHWLLTLLAVIPLGLNLLAFFVTCARVRLPGTNVAGLLAELPAGGGLSCGDVVEDIRQWRPPVEGPERPARDSSCTVARPVRRMSDEVWLVTVHTLGESAVLVDDSTREQLQRELGRPVRLVDARTYAGRNMVLRLQAPGIPAEEQPSCIVYVVHAPAPPTNDITHFMAELDRECPASAKAVLLADRSDAPERERQARDELWRTNVPQPGSQTNSGSVHHMIASVDTRMSGGPLCSQLARSIAEVVSPESSALPASPQGAKEAINFDEELSKSFALIARSVRILGNSSGKEFDTDLRRVTEQTMQGIDAIFAHDASLFDEVAATTSQLAREGGSYVAVASTHVRQSAHAKWNDIVERLETVAWRAASALSAIAVLTVFTGFIPLTFSVGVMAAAAWGLYSLVRVARSQLAVRVVDHDVGEPAIEEMAEQIAAFISKSVAAVCYQRWQSVEDACRLCRTRAMQWKQQAPLGRLPGEEDLKSCWRECFPDQRIA